jgi:hypothetical protein
LISSPVLLDFNLGTTFSKVTRGMTSPLENSTSIGCEPFSLPTARIAVRDATQMIQATAFSAQIPDVRYCHLDQMPASVLDTGASAHCFPLNEHFLQAAVPGSLIDCNIIMKTAKEGEYLTATKKADFLLKSTAKPKSPGVTPTVLLRQALLSSDLRRGLISTTALTNDGLSLQFEGDQCVIYDEVGGICLQISRGGLSLYEVPYSLFSFHQLAELNLSPAEVDTAYHYSTTATWMQLGQLTLNQAPHLTAVHTNSDRGTTSSHDNTLDCLFHHSESLLAQKKANAEQTIHALETAVARSEAAMTTVMQGASFLKQAVFFPELLGPHCISVAELIEQGFTITFGEGEIRVYGPDQEAYMDIRIDDKGYHAIPLEQFLPSYQEFYTLSSDKYKEYDGYTSHYDEPLPPPPPLPKVPNPAKAPRRPMMTRSRTKAAAQTSFLDRSRFTQGKTDIELADVLSEAEHALLQRRRQQRTINLDQNLGRRPFKRAKSAADALLNTGSTVTQAISIDSDSGDMESSEEESDHIDDSGPSTPYTKSDYQRYTWTQPSSPKPPPASPTAPPIVSAPNEPTLLSPDYLAPYNESYDSDYGAGLSSASDHDDPKMESQVTVEKQSSAMESCNEMNTAVEKQNSSYRCCSPSHCSQIIDLTNDDSDSDFINRTQARRTQVDGQSATHNDDDSDSDVTILQARRTQVNGQSAALNDDEANVSSAEDDYDSEAEEANDEMEALIAIRDFLRETAALRRNEALNT